MKKHLILSLLLTLTACNSAPTETLPPTAVPLTIAFSPAVKPITAAINTCASFQPETGLNLIETPAQALDVSTVDLVIRLGEPAEFPAFTAPLAWEQMVVILHPDNPIKQLSVKQVQDLFAGRIRQWIKGPASGVQVWVLLDAADSRQAFDGQFLGDSLITPAARLAPNPAAMLAAVTTDPGAIGYLPRAWVTDSVKVIELEGKLPVLALAAEEPSGPARDLLLCLQSAIGQAALLDQYTLWLDE